MTTKRCNAQGCDAWDCDECRNSACCDKHIVCDECEAEIYEGDSYYEIDGADLCEDCVKNQYGMVI